jgi:hypothetical protein
MWWITNQILKAGVKKITVMGESAKNWATAENGEKFSHSRLRRGVEFIHKIRTRDFAFVFIFNYFRNYPFSTISLFLSLTGTSSEKIYSLPDE